MQFGCCHLLHTPDSYNILAALIDEKRNKPIREAIVSHSVYGMFAIRQGDWKLILETKTSGGYPGGTAPKPGAPGQLYNLADDPYEKNDLWEKHPEVIKHLTGLFNLLPRTNSVNRQEPAVDNRSDSYPHIRFFKDLCFPASQVIPGQGGKPLRRYWIDLL